MGCCCGGEGRPMNSILKILVERGLGAFLGSLGVVLGSYRSKENLFKIETATLRKDELSLYRKIHIIIHVKSFKKKNSGLGVMYSCLGGKVSGKLSARLDFGKNSS